MSKWIVDIHGDIEGDYELICKAENIIPLDKVKQAKEEIENLYEDLDGSNCNKWQGRNLESIFYGYY